jgi:hypothetical protein
MTPVKTRKEADIYGRQEHTFMCPISLRPANGKYRFVAMRKCGCVLSQHALDEIEEEQCLVCSAKLEDTEENLLFPAKYQHSIPINPVVEEKEKLRDLFRIVKKYRKKNSKKAKLKKKEQRTQEALPPLAGPMTAEEYEAQSSSTSSSSATSTAMSTGASSVSQKKPTKRAKEEHAQVLSKDVAGAPSVQKKKKRKVKKLEKPAQPEPSAVWRKRDPRFEDPVFKSMFISDVEARSRKVSTISTKLQSGMSLL